MADIAVLPIVLKDAIIQIDVDNFAAACSSVVLTPSATPINFKGLTPSSVFTDVPTAVWTLALTLAQDVANAQSLWNYLFDNEGAAKTAVIKPQSGIGPTFTVVIVITPGSLGGSVDTVPTSAVTLGVRGKPIRTAAAATIPVVTSADKSTGPIAGGTLVEVTGSKFLGTTAVHFGTTAVPAGQFTVESDGTLFAVAPAQAAGSKPIKVTNAVGQSATSAAYTYV